MSVEFAHNQCHYTTSTEKAMFSMKQLNERCEMKSVCVNEIVTCSWRKVTDTALITITL